MSDPVDTAAIARRLRIQNDEQGIESATMRGSDEDLAKALGFANAKTAAGQFHIDIHVAVDACKHRFAHTHPRLEEQLGFVRGFLACRGWDIDVDDAILVMLTMPEEGNAVSEKRPRR